MLTKIGIDEPIENNFSAIMAECRAVSFSKIDDYGVSWLGYRILTVIDHILIKALRIKTLEDNGDNMLVNEGRDSEYIGVINYSIIALILFYHEKELPKDAISSIAAVKRFHDETAAKTKELLLIKNHDYGGAWKSMEITSFTDIIIARINRIKSIIRNEYKVKSENIDAQLMDIINYAVFALVKMRNKTVNE